MVSGWGGVENKVVKVVVRDQQQHDLPGRGQHNWPGQATTAQSTGASNNSTILPGGWQQHNPLLNDSTNPRSQQHNLPGQATTAQSTRAGNNSTDPRLTTPQTPRRRQHKSTETTAQSTSWGSQGNNSTNPARRQHKRPGGNNSRNHRRQHQDLPGRAKTSWCARATTARSPGNKAARQQHKPWLNNSTNTQRWQHKPQTLGQQE